MKINLNNFSKVTLTNVLTKACDAGFFEEEKLALLLWLDLNRQLRGTLENVKKAQQRVSDKSGSLTHVLSGPTKDLLELPQKTIRMMKVNRLIRRSKNFVKQIEELEAAFPRMH